MRIFLSAVVILTSLLTTAATFAGPVAPNGIALIEGYRNWQVISPSYRPDKGQIRLILGNGTAVKSLHEGKRPFPDGTIFAKVARKEEKHPRFPVALVPGEFAQVEFMVKDSGKYVKTGGWGFARFVGDRYQPYGKDPGFVQKCFG